LRSGAFFVTDLPLRTDAVFDKQKRFELPIQALDLVLGGKKLSNQKTLLECAVCAGFIVYLRVDMAIANHIMTTTLDITPG
jgi:hypothetical protein